MDDLYQNDGEDFQNGIYYPEVPEERVAEEVTEASTIASSYPVMQSVAKWFQEAITACDNLDNIQMTTMSINGVKYDRKTSVEAQVLAYQLLKAKLNEKYHEFEEFAEDEA